MNETIPASTEHSHFNEAVVALNHATPFPSLTQRSVKASLTPLADRRRQPNRPDAVFFALARSIEERDIALAGHCRRLALMSSAIGMLLRLPASEIRTLSRAGYLHDIGKITLPDNILLKAGPLTREEWEIMKTHPIEGEQMCRGVLSLQPLLPIIRHHHENWDGSGYPDGLAGERIPFLARIIQMADIYDALTSERPYKAAFSSEDALQTMKAETVKGLRDPHLMPVMEAAIPLFRSEPFWQTEPFSLNALSEVVSARI